MLASPTDMNDLTARQQRIVEFIRRTVLERGYPPTVREIGEAVGLTSSSSVHAQLANLQRKGLLRKDPAKPRAIEVAGTRPRGAGAVTVPILGSIAAAQVPGPAEEEATVKRLRRRGRRVTLVPENPTMEPFDLPEGGRILGQVVAVLRRL